LALRRAAKTARDYLAIALAQSEQLKLATTGVENPTAIHPLSDLLDANESTWTFRAAERVGCDRNSHVTALEKLSG
jgi:hypothetical protein